jgi:hypothetical protein
MVGIWLALFLTVLQRLAALRKPTAFGNVYEPIGVEADDDEQIELHERRSALPHQARCSHNMDKWIIPDYPHSALNRIVNPTQPWIVFRGATFRASAELQEQALCSMSRHVVQPLKTTYALTSLHVHLCVRPHKSNQQIVDSAERYFGVSKEDISLREVSNEEQPGQLGQYQACMEDVPNHAGFVLILRPDLIFRDSLNFERALSADRFYFQWNLFQDCKNREIADQIHFIGGNLIQEFKTKWNSTKIVYDPFRLPWNDAEAYYDTLHMMYNWAEEAFGKERLGYLNQYDVDNCFYDWTDGIKWHKYGICKQVGNSQTKGRGKLFNPLFEYDRNVLADAASSCV